jgi:hypothetical protein
MQELTEILAGATAAIQPLYFRLPIDGGDPVYRERVYCYELYHQMRCRWPQEGDFYLTGEVDKSAHPILAGLGLADKKPDFLVHGPGHMERNHAVIEVKSVRSLAAGLAKDLDTLGRFVLHAGYQRAIYLIYGDGLGEQEQKRITGAFATAEHRTPVEVWFHTTPGQSAAHAWTLEPP